jgi:hypothetical protein
VLDPAWLRIVLRDLAIRSGQHVAVIVEDQRR